jgi:hypothetical protein
LTTILSAYLKWPLTYIRLFSVSEYIHLTSCFSSPLLNDCQCCEKVEKRGFRWNVSASHCSSTRCSRNGNRRVERRSVGAHGTNTVGNVKFIAATGLECSKLNAATFEGTVFHQTCLIEKIATTNPMSFLKKSINRYGMFTAKIACPVNSPKMRTQ